jgi:hypothetical protein
MIRRKRDAWLALTLVLVLVAVVTAAAVHQAHQQEPPPLASFSDAPDGARALRLWLEALDYPVLDERQSFFSIPQDASLAWILEPTVAILPGEWDLIDAWVEDGGTLILAGDRLAAWQAFGHYDARLTTFLQPVETIRLQTPLMVSPPITGPIPARATLYFAELGKPAIVHLAEAGHPVLVSMEQGKGQVVLSTAPFPLSNLGLKLAPNPDFVLNLIALAQRSGGVWFDEWHHGVRQAGQEISGPAEWLRYTPAGNSLLFVALVALLWAITHGRPLGRPVYLRRALARRPPLEYVTALANLSRRLGHRADVLTYLHDQLKRQIGGRYRIDPRLPDEEYAAQAALVRPDLDQHELLDLLQRLGNPGIGEKEMVQLAREASDWIRQA